MSKPKNPEVEETFEHDDLSEKDKADLAALDSLEDIEYHTLLEVWTALLEPAAAELGKRVHPQWATRTISQYPEMTFAAMPLFRDLYYGKLGEMKKILADEIASDDRCLDRKERVEDATDNATHYKNLLLLWQMQIQEWEIAWDTAHPDAPADLASISEVHKLFFGEMGIVQHLSEIGFEFTEDDQQVLADALQAQREGDDE